MLKDVLRNFEDFGRNIAVPLMPTLKFSNGGYFVYNGAVDVPFDNVKLIANMPTLRTGWVRYDCGFAVKRIMGKVSENFQPARRADLGDCDMSLWKEDEHGMRMTRGAPPRMSSCVISTSWIVAFSSPSMTTAIIRVSIGCVIGGTAFTKRNRSAFSVRFTLHTRAVRQMSCR
jgi:hypothetical protein